MSETPVPQTVTQAITMDELFRQKGEVVTQIEIAQGKLNMINSQLQQAINQQANAVKNGPA